MCTLIVAHQVFENYPIVVAANRDEQLGRLSKPPCIRDEEFQIYAPKDLRGGGTWIGVNGYGVFSALTNRSDVIFYNDCMSRGVLVMNALHAKSAREAYENTYHLDREKLNGFYLVIADQKDLFLLRGNGKTIQRSREASGLLIVTNQGVSSNFSPQDSQRIRNIWHEIQEKKILEQKPDVENLSKLLCLHDDIHGTCILKPENMYGTKSSSIVWLHDGTDRTWHYWHRERPDNECHICSCKFEEPRVLLLKPDYLGSYF